MESLICRRLLSYEGTHPRVRVPLLASEAMRRVAEALENTTEKWQSLKIRLKSDISEVLISGGQSFAPKGAGGRGAQRGVRGAGGILLMITLIPINLIQS